MDNNIKNPEQDLQNDGLANVAEELDDDQLEGAAGGKISVRTTKKTKISTSKIDPSKFMKQIPKDIC